jgi:hypothetical protein
MAGEDSFLDGASVKGKPKVGATVVKGVDLAIVVDDKERAALPADDDSALARSTSSSVPTRTNPALALPMVKFQQVRKSRPRTHHTRHWWPRF